MSNPDRTLHLGEHVYRGVSARVSSEFLSFLGEQYYRIKNYDKTDPFFMNLISSAGRVCFDHPGADRSLLLYPQRDWLQQTTGRLWRIPGRSGFSHTGRLRGEATRFNRAGEGGVVGTLGRIGRFHMRRSAFF